MDSSLFNSQLWNPALEKYGEVTGLSVELFGIDGKTAHGPIHPSPLVNLFQKHGFEPGLFAECARRCLLQTGIRPAVAVTEAHGLSVVGSSLMLDGVIVGAAVSGYAFAGFAQVIAVQRWAKSAGVPFDSLWDIARQQQPVPERRLLLHGELLQVLGDALLREHHRTRQYEDMVIQLKAAAAAKDEFLAVVSHELRTPLAPILGWATILKGDHSPAQVTKAAEAIERNVLLQTRMVDDLLDTNLTARGVVKLHLKIQELADCVRSAMETNAHDIRKKGIRVEFVDAGEPLFVEADSSRLQQVFGNIISNAVKFTPAGGAITIAVTRETDCAKVIVADTGVGVSPAFLPFVFDMFRQQEYGTQREFEGLGIGLALVKKLTEIQKGMVNVTSAGTGRGTQVTVRFPLAAAPYATETAPEKEKPPAATLTGLSVLVVDDIEDAREALRELLQHLGAKVSVAGSGREGLDILREAEPDLVLCDLRMPRMDGFEFVRELNRAGSQAHPPVVAVSALTSAADHLRTRDAGFKGHIDKPYDEVAIVAAVYAALHRNPDTPIRVPKAVES